MSWERDLIAHLERAASDPLVWPDLDAWWRNASPEDVAALARFEAAWTADFLAWRSRVLGWRPRVPA